MQAFPRPSGNGWQWLRNGFLLWKRSPAFISFLCFGYFLLPLVLAALPYVGPFAAALIVPALSVGVLNGCRAVELGQPPRPELLFSAFRRNLRALMTIGALNYFATLAILLLSMAVDGGELMRALTGGAPPPDPESPVNPGVMLALLLTITLYTPVTMAYWFAPLLAGWARLSPAKALVFSFVACWRNWRPFLTFALAILLCCALLPGLVLTIVSLVSPLLGRVFSVILPVVMLPIVFASFYANARDVFADLEPPAVL